MGLQASKGQTRASVMGEGREQPFAVTLMIQLKAATEVADD